MEDIPVFYIRTEAELIQAVEELSVCTELALDVEFDRDRYSYGTTICLIQVFSGNRCYLFDPIAGPAPEALYRLIENQAITKIMHSPGEDLQILHLQHCYPRNIFDTERAARLLNHEAFSLSSLLKNICGIELNKSVQKTNWNQRPLSDAQIQYACSDVAWLPGLRNALVQAAREKHILSWVEEENKAWDNYRAEPKPDGVFTHRDDAKKYPPYELFLLNELLKFRDEHAKRLNKPGYMVISRDLLDEILQNPGILSGWSGLKGIHQSLRNDRVRHALENLLEQADRSARDQGLGKRHPAKTRTEGTFRPRQEIKDEVEQVFRPLKQEIAKRWGEHTAAYILNEKIMTELSSGTRKLSALPYPYRIKLMVEIAAELGIDLSKYH